MQMNRSGKKIAIIGLSLAVFCVIAYRPLLITYHRANVADGRQGPRLPAQTWKECFSVDYLRWTLKGRPEFDAMQTNAREHEEALVRLGYYERRTYFPTNFSHETVRTIRTNRIKDKYMFFSQKQDGSLEVIAHRDDYGIIEKALNTSTIQRKAADALPDK